MKAAEVLKVLKISRPTLCNYLKDGKIIGTAQPNGYYDYDEESVYKLINKDVSRINVIYARVSTKKQKPDLSNQIDNLKQFCSSQGIIVSRIYQDISSGMDFERKEFQAMLADAIEHKIRHIYITYPDRLSRLSYKMFKELFSRFNVEIKAIYETNDPQLLEKEVFQEIISLLHCFAMKMYSRRRRDRLTLAKKQLELEEENATTRG